jgi:hypothetical protein
MGQQFVPGLELARRFSCERFSEVCAGSRGIKPVLTPRMISGYPSRAGRLHPRGGYLPRHPGEVLGVAAAPGVQGAGQWFESFPGAHRTDRAYRRDGVVGQLQTVTFTGPDVDGDQRDAGPSVAESAEPFPALHR